MKAGIITIGTEILIGSILNTNSKFLSKRLSEFGVHVSYHVSVRDNAIELSEVINELLNKVDLLFLCGGLGPTNDDITKEVLSNVLGRSCIVDEVQYKKLIDKFKIAGREMTANNKKQIIVIDEAVVLDNKWGVAPGEIINYNNKKIFLLPGPPREFEPMIDFYLKNFINENNQIIVKSVNIAGIGESRVEDILRKLKLEEHNISINTFAKFYDTEIKIIAEGTDTKQLQRKIDSIVKKLYEVFEGYLYAEDNASISESIVKKLTEKKLTISFAESVTGGLLASKITSVPNSSKILKNSIVTYSNESKIKLLNVNEKTLNKYGAVSPEVAYEMANGLKDIGFSDISVSVTGEAGPISSEKEVGLIFVCYYFKNYYEIKKYYFTGSRNEIQERTANTILQHVLFNI